MGAYKQSSHVKLVFFSGTGGTAKIADCMHDTLLKNGITVTQVELSLKTSTVNAAEDMLMVIFPVYAFNAPAIIEDYIAQCKKVINIPAVVLSVSGGGDIIPNTACRVRTIKLLEKKGYRVVYEKMLVMPSNFAAKTPDDLAVRLIEVIPEKVQKIVSDLMSGVVLRKKPYYIDRALSYMGKAEKLAAPYFGKNIKLSGSCTGCGLCAKSCPTGNIHLDSTGRPVFGGKCITCFRCLYNCPQKALSAGIGNFAILKEGFSLEAIEKRMDGKVPDPPQNFEKNYLFLGVVKYLKET